LHTIKDIYQFLEKEVGVKSKYLAPNTDLFLDLHIEGDDFFELEESFEKQFNVDMSSYRWYFHHGEEGWNPGGLFFKAPQDCVTRIPVTPNLLLDSANNNQWMLDYPEHTIPHKRYDLTLNIVFTIFNVLIILVIIVAKFST
jgi:hypothetical protein